LSHKAEYDKIIYEDKDKENGFIMLPDLKWDGTLASLDILVLAKKRIKSLRELNDSHLPLLKNIRDTGTDIIQKKYNLSSSQLRIYLHYQPSYYHLHVHFSYLMHEVPGTYNFTLIHLLNYILIYLLCNIIKNNKTSKQNQNIFLSS
jgi:m7GpppX diphosphatase